MSVSSVVRLPGIARTFGRRRYSDTRRYSSCSSGDGEKSSTMREPYVLANLTAKRSLDRSGEALPKLSRRALAQACLASIGDVSRSEGLLWSQNLLVEQSHQPK